MTDRSPEEQLNQKLESLLKSKVNLRLNQNRSTYLSCKLFAGSVYKISLHRNFLHAPDSVLEALVRYIQKGERSDTEIMREFVSQQDTPEHENSSHRQRPKRLNAVGKTYDLRQIADEINAEYFDGKLTFTIGWNPRKPPRSPSPRPKSILLGRCYPTTRAITIHPLLDHAEMPQYFVAFVVYHEMCHLVVPFIKTASGRHQIHTPEFRALEAEFADYQRAMAFEKKELRRFLKLWHSGDYQKKKKELHLLDAINNMVKRIKGLESKAQPTTKPPPKKKPQPKETISRSEADEPDDEQLSLF